MKKLLFMGAGIIVGGTMVALMYNSKPLAKRLRTCKQSMICALDEAMEDLAMLIESIDEEKMKQRLTSKYNYYKRKIEKIDLDNFEESIQNKVSKMIDEIKKLINQTKDIELNS